MDVAVVENVEAAVAFSDLAGVAALAAELVVVADAPVVLELGPGPVPVPARVVAFDVLVVVRAAEPVAVAVAADGAAANSVDAVAECLGVGNSEVLILAVTAGRLAVLEHVVGDVAEDAS